MASMSKFGRQTTLAVVLVSLAASLNGCGGGGSSGTAGNTTTSQTTSAVATQTRSGLPPNSRTGTTQSSTSSQSSTGSASSESEVAAVRTRALESYEKCLHNHFISTTQTSLSAAQKPVAKACLVKAEAQFKAETSR